jgi:POT family proton-dependent oligopeptide transporter
MAGGTTDGAVKERTLFGHPIGLSYLFTTEMWERFSYYGMRALLILTLANYLLLQPTADSVIGYQSLKHFFEIVYNGGDPLGPYPLASLVYGNYTSFVYLTPLIGGVIADRWLGQRNSVIVGAAIMAIGEFTLMSPHLFFLGLLFLIIGNGFFKPNISTQVGTLYKPGDSRIDRAFSIFYVGINVGAFFSPLICGSLGEAYGYHWGYFAAGVGMVIGLVSYLFALKTLPSDRITRLSGRTGFEKWLKLDSWKTLLKPDRWKQRFALEMPPADRAQLKTAKKTKTPLTKQEWKAVIALFLLFIPGCLFWAAYEQQGNTISLFAQDFTDRRLIPGLINWQIPVTWFQAFNPGMIVAFTPLVVGLWAWQAKRNTEPSVLTKMALGNLMMGASYLIMIAAVYFTGHGQVSWLWLFFFFAVITMGELYFSPIGLALTARVAPPQIVSMMMGVWLMTSFVGNNLQGFIGSYFTRMDKMAFFLLCAAIGAFAGVVFWLFNFPLKSILVSRTPNTKPAGG